MYIEEVEASATKSEDKSLEDSSKPIAELVVDYAQRSKLAQSTSLNFSKRSTEFESMDRRDDKSAKKSTAGRFNVEEYSSKSTRSLDPRVSLEDDANETNEMCEEKPVRNGINGKSRENIYDDSEQSNGNIEATMEEDKSGYHDDSFESDNDEDSAGLFGKKLKSIFIRKSENNANAEESSRSTKVPSLHNAVPRIVKKGDEPPTKLKKKRAISFIDTLITLFVVAPLVIGHWRGIWNMMDIYSDYFPEWLCFVLGTFLHLLFAIMRDGFHGRFVEKWRTRNVAGRVAYDLVRLIYIYIFGFACNAHWRGGWMIFSRYFGSNVWVVSFFTVLFIAGLVTLRAFRNLLAPPFIVIIDQPERVFKFPTRYNVVSAVSFPLANRVSIKALHLSGCSKKEPALWNFFFHQL